MKKAITIGPMILALFALFCCLFTGCITKEKCEARFPMQTKQKDSTITVIRDSIRHDTLWVPYQEVLFGSDVPCPELEFHKEVKKNNVSASVSISKGRIMFKCAADSLQHIVDEHERTIEILKSKEEVKEKIIKEYITHWYDPFPFYWTIITLPLLIIGLAWRIARK